MTSKKTRQPAPWSALQVALLSPLAYVLGVLLMNAIRH